MLVEYVEAMVRQLMLTPEPLMVVAWAVVFVGGLLWLKR